MSSPSIFFLLLLPRIITGNVLFPAAITQSLHCVLAFMPCGLHSKSDFFILFVCLFSLKFFLIYFLEHLSIFTFKFCVRCCQKLNNLVCFLQVSKLTYQFWNSDIVMLIFFPLSLPLVFNPIPNQVVLCSPPPKSWSPNPKWGLLGFQLILGMYLMLSQSLQAAWFCSGYKDASSFKCILKFSESHSPM